MKTSKLITSVLSLVISGAALLSAAPPPPPVSGGGTGTSGATVDTFYSQAQQLQDAAERMQQDSNQQLQQMQSLLAVGRNGNIAFYDGSLRNGADRPVVIAASSIEPTAIAELNEDLKILGKLINDALMDENVAERRAMGIPISVNRSVPRPLYVEGYGAIFQANVRFPLLAEQDGPKPTPAKTNSPWDTARREIYGAPEDSDNDPANLKREAYDADRVQALKQSLLKALGNAHHVRQLKSGEKITVVVRSERGRQVMLGAPYNPNLSSPGAGKPGTVSVKSAKMTVNNYRAAGAPEQTLTVSVKKSDAEALTDGKIKEDEFFKRAAIAVY